MSELASNTDPLAGLREYHLPEVPSWWPPGPGWWVLLAILFLGVTAGAWWYSRHLSRQAATRQALRELSELRERSSREGQSAACLRELSRLLRRYAMSRYPHHEVAALTGEAWLRFLDHHGGGGRFQQGPGRHLVDAPYRAEAVTEWDELLALVEEWVGRNRKAQPEKME